MPMKSPYPSGQVSANTGRRLLLERSVKGNRTSTKSPRSNIVPNPVFGMIPYRRQRIGLGIHEIAPLLAVAMLAKVTDKIEHLARKRLGQGLGLLINKFRSRHSVLLAARTL